MSPATDQILEEAPAAPEAIVETIGPYRVHWAARLLPDPTPQQYEQILADIREIGRLRVPVVLTQDGQILDGRTRARACTELGIPILTRAATLDEGLDPLAFVLSMNAARRHLTGDQVIALYLEANKTTIEVDQQAAKIAQQAGLKKGSTQPKPVSTTVKPTGKTAAKIAKAVGKSKSAVERVQRVKKFAPERFTEMVEGKTSAMQVLEEIVPPAAEVSSNRGTKSDEYGVAYLDTLGRRRPNRPLQEQMDRLDTGLSIGIHRARLGKARAKASAHWAPRSALVAHTQAAHAGDSVGQEGNREGGYVVLTVLEGTVAEISDSALLLEPATRIMLPAGCVTAPVRVGARVLVRARRVRGQYVAESVTVRPAAQ